MVRIERLPRGARSDGARPAAGSSGSACVAAAATGRPSSARQRRRRGVVQPRAAWRPRRRYRDHRVRQRRAGCTGTAAGRRGSLPFRRSARCSAAGTSPVDAPADRPDRTCRCWADRRAQRPTRRPRARRRSSATHDGGHLLGGDRRADASSVPRAGSGRSASSRSGRAAQRLAAPGRRAPACHGQRPAGGAWSSSHGCA